MATSVFFSLTHREMSSSTSGSSALTGEMPRLSSGIFQKLRVLGRCMPITNLPGLPFLSVESATTAAITAPTNPSPTTTTTSRPWRVLLRQLLQPPILLLVIGAGRELEHFPCGTDQIRVLWAFQLQILIAWGL